MTVIARPRVTVEPVVYSAAGNHQWLAACEHCPWTYRNAIRSDVEQQARWHRDAHRRGVAEVTP